MSIGTLRKNGLTNGPKLINGTWTQRQLIQVWIVTSPYSCVCVCVKLGEGMQ